VSPDVAGPTIAVHVPGFVANVTPLNILRLKVEVPKFRTIKHFSRSADSVFEPQNSVNLSTVSNYKVEKLKYKEFIPSTEFTNFSLLVIVSRSFGPFNSPGFSG